MICGGPLLPEILGQTDRIGEKSPIFIYFRSQRLSRNAERKKVQLTLIGSPLRAFQWAQDEHRTLSLSPKVGQKTQSVQNLNNMLQ